MDIREELDFDLKLRAAGAVCASVCIILRATAFRGNPINPLVTALPYVLAAIIGFIKVVLAALDAGAEDDDEFDTDTAFEAYEKETDSFRRKNRMACMAVTLAGGTDIVTAVLMLILKW